METKVVGTQVFMTSVKIYKRASLIQIHYLFGSESFYLLLNFKIATAEGKNVVLLAD
jgi:hypothetical protein